jgi:hypothetical protein
VSEDIDDLRERVRLLRAALRTEHEAALPPPQLTVDQHVRSTIVKLERRLELALLDRNQAVHGDRSRA